RDGMSTTMFVGEFSKFRNDPDREFNQWSSAIYYSSSMPGVSRPQGLATTVPRINANLAVPDVVQSHPTLWKSVPANFDFGQFGFRSQHPGGANFLFGDASVRFISQTIDLKGVYWPLSTRDGYEVLSADSY